MQQNYSLSFRTIATSLRPAKVVTFMNNSDPHWIHTCLRIIEFYSLTWGGLYDLIVPTDGKTIDEQFWYLLKKYDPDYLYSYNKTGLDLKLANPAEYGLLRDKKVETALKHDSGTDRDAAKDFFEDHLLRHPIERFEISRQLSEEILRKLNPFHSRRRVIHSRISASTYSVHPLTSLVDIWPTMALEEIVDLQIESEPVIKLMGYSVAGSARSFKPAIEEKRKELQRFASPESPELNRHLQMLADMETRVARATFEEENLVHLLELLWSESFDEAVPFSPSLTYLGFYVPKEGLRAEEDVVLVVGDSVEDFCLYYNLSRLRKDVIWVPFELLERYKEKAGKWKRGDPPLQRVDSFPIWLAFELGRKTLYGESDVTIMTISNSLNKNQLATAKQIIKQASLKADREEVPRSIRICSNLDEVLPCARRVYERNNHWNAYIEQFVDGESTNFINTPKPRPENFSKIQPQEFRWVSEVRISETDPEKGYTLPARPCFGNQIFLESPWSSGTWGVRVSSQGISYFCPGMGLIRPDDHIDNVLVKPRLKLLESFEIFEILFRDANLSITPSDKGNYMQESMSKFGSLRQMAKALQNEIYRTVFDEFIKTPDKNKNIKKKNGLGILLKDNRRYLDFPSLSKIIGNGEETEGFLDIQLTKGIIHRGLVFKCEKCRNTDWYPVDEITTNFRCKRCSFDQPYKTQHWKLRGATGEPPWYYKLDEVVYQGYLHEMIAPIFTLHTLLISAKESFLFIPEIEIRKDPSSKRPDLEIDICCIKDGTIIMGECKKKPELTSAEMTKYKDLAQKIGANEVIFSTLAEKWSDDKTEVIQKSFLNTGIEVDFYCQADLLP